MYGEGKGLLLSYAVITRIIHASRCRKIGEGILKGPYRFRRGTRREAPGAHFRERTDHQTGAGSGDTGDGTGVMRLRSATSL